MNHSKLSATVLLIAATVSMMLVISWGESSFWQRLIVFYVFVHVILNSVNTIFAKPTTNN